MTKTCLIDHYIESENMVFSNRHQNSINNNNNLIINKCVTKLGDIVTNHQNNKSLNTRVRHHSQQQLNLNNNNNNNNQINRTSKITKDIDVNASINSYESEHHVTYLSKKIESTLKEAKQAKKLNCTEILIPQMLTKQIGQDIVAMAETEPCGLRGCILYINIEEKTLCRRLGEVKLDKSSVPTFEMYLTLKRANPSWIDTVENKILRKESVILSELYRLSKKKLYRSLSSP